MQLFHVVPRNEQSPSGCPRNKTHLEKKHQKGFLILQVILLQTQKQVCSITFCQHWLHSVLVGFQERLNKETQWQESGRIVHLNRELMAQLRYLAGSTKASPLRLHPSACSEPFRRRLERATPESESRSSKEVLSCGFKLS